MNNDQVDLILYRFMYGGSPPLPMVVALPVGPYTRINPWLAKGEYIRNGVMSRAQLGSGINTHSLDIGIILSCITSMLVLPICDFFSQYINTL